MAQKQTAESVKILEGAAGIRHAPNMYLGEGGNPMVYRMLKEIVDNCFDEALAGRNNWIEVHIDYNNNLYVVADKAGGIPIEMKALESGRKISALTAIFTMTHAGGKFDDDAYKVSTGTHGVGSTAVNACSSRLRVWTTRNKKTYEQEFVEGKPVVEVPKLGKPSADVQKFLTSSAYGTVVSFTPDQTVVSIDAVKGKKIAISKLTPAYADHKQVRQWLHSISELNPNITIVLGLYKGGKRKVETFHNKVGLEGAVKKICEDYAEDEDFGTFGKPLIYKSDYITVAAQFTSLANVWPLRSSCNNSPTINGGTHVRGLTDALLEAIKPYENAKQRKDRKRMYSGEDLLMGVVGYFDWRMHGASYDSQVKDKLVSKVDAQVKAELLPVFTAYFAANKSVPQKILARAQKLEEGRQALAKIVGAAAAAKKQQRGGALPAVLAAGSTKDNNLREIYFAEGSSAGGSCKQARNPVYQEVFKCQGKMINPLNATLDKILGNAVTRDTLIALGCDLSALDLKTPNPTFSADKLRVARVYLLADADDDGCHINVLQLATLWRLCPDLIRQGRVYVVDAPLYNVMHKGQHYGGRTREECLAKCPSTVKAGDIQRAKGWGEVPVDIMEWIAFNPETRKVRRVLPPKESESLDWFLRVVGDDASARRQLLGLGD